MDNEYSDYNDLADLHRKSQVEQEIPDTKMLGVNGSEGRLFVGGTDSPPEHEAISVADKVMEGNVANVGQMSNSINRKGEGNGLVDSEVQRKIDERRGLGESLPEDVRIQMEHGMNSDFNDVKIHNGSEATVMSSKVNADAFTFGNDVYFNEGQYQPNTTEGQHLIAHELAHVVQHSNSDQNNVIDRQPPGKKLTKPKDAGKSRVVKLVELELKKEKDKIDKKKLLELIGEFSITDISNNVESIMTTMKDKVDDKTYIDAYIIFQDNYWGENRKEVQERTDWQESNLKEVGNVKSLTAITVYDDQIPGLWSAVGSKMSSRDKNLGVVRDWKEVTGNATIKSAIDASISRWSELKKLIADAKFDSIKGKLPSTTDTDIVNEEANIAAIPGTSSKDRLYYTKAAMKEFVSALKSYKSQRAERVVELQQYKRFDELFTQAKMYTLLTARNVLTPSSIKALTSQESGDYTWVNVGGIEKDKPGYKNTMSVGNVYTGIAQMGAPAQKEAIKWASANGVVIPEKISGTDTRDIPEYAVLLSAAYLSHLYDKLEEKYGKRLPSADIEVSKLIFCCYNWNFASFCSSVDKHLGKTDPITFEVMKPYLPGETQTYVDKIMKRLN